MHELTGQSCMNYLGGLAGISLALGCELNVHPCVNSVGTPG